MENKKQSFFNENEEASKTLVMAPLTQDETLRKAVQSKKARLGLWNNMVFNKEHGEALRKRMGHIAIAILEEQRTDIMHRLMLESDRKKKKNFAHYQEMVDKLNKEIIDRSETMGGELTDMFFAGRETILVRQKKWSDNNTRMFNEGVITETEKSKEDAVLRTWIDKMLNTIEDKIDLLLSSHTVALQETLKVLDQRAILQIGE